MKRWILAGLGLALALALAALIPLMGGCDDSARSAQVTDLATNQASVSNTTPATAGPSVPDATVQQLANAPGTIVSTPATAAPDTGNNPKLNEVVKLAQAGLGDSILMAYVTNSPDAFNVSSDDVVYLNDLGVPQTVVAAMLQRDQYFSSATAQPPMQPGYASAPPVESAYANPPPAVPPPAPDQYAAQPTTDPAAPLMVDTNAPPLNASPDVVDDAEQAPNGAYPYFYDSLSPYGNWIDIDGYGLCWQPTTVVMNPGWQPYCDGGHWVYTDCGWCWVSDYSWGWAPFHYGRWFHNNRWGWCWAPDTVWGPAWVSWRFNDSYCGWSPLPPTALYRPGYGFTFFGQSVGFNFTFGLAPDSFVFVSLDHFNERSLNRFRLDHRDVTKIFRSTVLNNQLICGPNNTLINRGVPAQLVANATRMEIRPVHIRTDVEGPGAAQFGRDGRSLSLYRPSLPMARLTSRPTLVGEGVQRDANFSLQSRVDQAQQRQSVNPANSITPDRQPMISNPTTTAPRENYGAETPGNNNGFSQPAWGSTPGRVDNSVPNQWPNYSRGQSFQSQPTTPAQDNRRIFMPQDNAPRYSPPQWGQRQWPQQPYTSAPRVYPPQETGPRNYENTPRSYESHSAPSGGGNTESHESSSQNNNQNNQNNQNSNNGNGGGGGRGH